jgi:rubrerythrin
VSAGRRGAAAVPRSMEEFMAQALAMEREAVARYTEFADAMDVHNNADVAQMFRKMAQYEGEHARRILEQMGWTADPPPPAGGFGWPGLEGPETVPSDGVHYLMRPWHALQVALAAEQRAEAFFGELARAAPDDAVRRAALEMQADEREHVELVLAWLAKMPEPERDWATDPDPPRYTD